MFEDNSLSFSLEQIDPNTFQQYLDEASEMLLSPDMDIEVEKKGEIVRLLAKAFTLLHPNIGDYVPGDTPKRDALKGKYETPITELISSLIKKEIDSGIDLFTAIAKISAMVSPPYNDKAPKEITDNAVTIEQSIALPEVKCRHQALITAKIANNYFIKQPEKDHQVRVVYFSGFTHRGRESSDGHHFVELRRKTAEGILVGFIDITNPQLTEDVSGSVIQGTHEVAMKKLFEKYQAEKIQVVEFESVNLETNDAEMYYPAEYT